MNAAKQAVWLFSVLILLAFTGWYFARATPLPKMDDNSLSVTADTIIHDLSVQQFDDQGRLINYLQTPLLRHIPLNNTHFLQTPKVTIVQENQPPWDIQSQEATALNGGEQITFQRQVIIHQSKDAKGMESTMRTEEITYFPKTKIANTPLAVTLEQPGTLVESIGMHADLAAKKVELLHQARGSYVPKHG